MAGASDGFAEFLREQLAPLGQVTLRRLFGTTGLWRDGVLFGLVRDDMLFLRAGAGDDPAQPPFSYRKAGQDFDLPYRQVPDGLLDEPEELLDRARTAMAEARRAALRRGTRASGPRKQNR